MLDKIRDMARGRLHKTSVFFKEAIGIEPESLARLSLANESLVIDAPTFKHLLPFECMDENGIFHNHENTGFGLYIAPMAGANIDLVKAHADLIKHKLPEGVYLTSMLYRHHYLEEALARGFNPLLKRGGMYAAIASMSLRYHLRAARTGYKNRRNIPAQLADYRSYLFVSVKKSPDASRMLSDFRMTLESDLQVMGYQHARMNETDLATLVLTLTSPDLNATRWPDISMEAGEPLSSAMVKPGTSFVVNDDSVDVTVASADGESCITRLVSLHIEKRPEQFALWSTPDLFANMFTPDKGMQCPFLISFTIIGGNQETIRQEAKRKAESLAKSNNSVQRMLNPNLTEELSEWQYAYEETNKGNLTLNHTFYNILLFTSKADERKHVAQTVSAWREFGFELSQKPMSSWIRFLASLPFFLNDKSFKTLERFDNTKRQSHKSAANMIPFIADFKGSPQGMLLPTYRNQIAYVDTFDSKNLPLTNFNVVVAGSSGSGKSFFMQHMLLSRLANDEMIFVIDVGDSYKSICELLGGTYLNASSFSLNPFTLFDFDGEVEIDGKVFKNHTQIRDLLSIMASPNEPLSSIQNDYLLSAVLACWNRHGRKSNMDAVIEELRIMLEKPESKDDRRLCDLIVHLEKFTRNGVYGDMFNSDTPFLANNRFVVLEMGEFEENPELLSIVLFVMIVVIQGQFYHTDRLTRKFCVIDEAWRFIARGSNPVAARFIDQGFRTARKYNAGFGVIFQNLSVMSGSMQGQAVASCSDTKFIMRQGDLDAYLLTNPDAFNDLQKELIRGFGEASGQGFSNLMVQYGKAFTFHRYFADPFTRALFSSNATEFTLIQKLKGEGISLEEAVYQVAEQNYGDEL